MDAPGIWRKFFASESAAQSDNTANPNCSPCPSLRWSGCFLYHSPTSAKRAVIYTTTVAICGRAAETRIKTYYALNIM